MDPATALGVASAILTFVTFGTALLKVGHGVCVTPSGRNEQNMTREVVLDETKTFLDQLLLSNDPRITGDQGLCRLIEESRRIAKKMIEILEKTKPKTSGTIANLRSAIRHTLSQPDMDDLEKRMDHCRSQLDLYLSSEYFNNLKRSFDQMLDQGKLNTSQLLQLQTNIDHLRRGVVIDSLTDNAQDQFRRLMGVQKESLDRVYQHMILKALKFPQMYDRFDALDPAHEKSFHWLLSDNHDSSLSNDESTFSESESSVEDLFFKVVDRDGRHDQLMTFSKNKIPPGESWHRLSTSSSIDSYQNQNISPKVEARRRWDSLKWKSATMRKIARKKFLNWLSSSNDIFHICGNLGSGKSALMKYLLEHSRTQAELQTWAGEGKSLVCASFFFWKPGTKLQKSLPGLFRSLLHDIFAACPELIQSVMPTIWARVMDQPYPQSGFKVPPKDIQIAFEKLIRDEKLYTHHRFCFFIDGLDEYEQSGQQDHKSLVEMLISWTKISNGNVKLCVSSRPENAFINAFNRDYRLHVHDLTLNDIHSYVQHQLSHLPDDKAKRTLIRKVVSKADGIFLWAVLVLRSMREAIEDGRSVADLADLLGSTPTELEDLFHQILKTLSKQKLKKACKSFAMLDKIDQSHSSSQILGDHLPKLRLLAYSFLDDYERDQKFAVRDDFLKFVQSGKPKITERLEMAAKQLRANCGGLLEVRVKQHGTQDPAGLPIDYTHRSVCEYLEGVRNDKEASFILPEKDFDAGDAASSLILAQIRALGPGHPEHHKYGGLTLLRLGAVATPDQKSYDFLECIDSLTGEAGLHDVAGPGDKSLKIQLGDQEWLGHRVSFPGNTGIPPFGTNQDQSLEDCRMDRPILVAILHGFNDYAAWKLRHDPGVVDSSTKRMVLLDVFTGVNCPKDHPLWDAIFEAGVFSLDENMGFLADVNRPTSIGQWDTTHCAWFSPWRQSLVSAANHVLRQVAISELKEWQAQRAERWGQLYEEFLRRGAAGDEMDIAVTPGHLLSESRRELRIEKVSFRFGEACLAWAWNSDRCVFTDFVDGESTTNLDIKVLQWFSDISGTDIESGKEMCITFREYIRAIGLPNQDVLFSLLDGQGEFGGPTGAKAVGKVAEAKLPPLLESVEMAKNTARNLWEGMDANFALAFGTGVLVSLVVVFIWTVSFGGEWA